MNIKLAASLRNLKKKNDVVQTELAKQKTELPKLSQKGYPQSLLDFLTEKIDEVLGVVGEATVMYGKLAIKPDETDKARCEEVRTNIKEVDLELTRVVEVKLKYDKKHGADMKKLCSDTD